jgi:hypothetical protein
MTDNPTDQTPSDDPLLGQLRRLARTVDPVPNEVTAYARAALGWRRVDAELAELLADSRLEAPSGTRSIAESMRSLTFRSTDVELDVEIEESGDRLLLLGQLAPSTKAQIDVQRDDGKILASTSGDDLGRFRFELPVGGRIRLVVRRGAPAPPIETSWI